MRTGLELGLSPNKVSIASGPRSDVMLMLPVLICGGNIYFITYRMFFRRSDLDCGQILLPDNQSIIHPCLARTLSSGVECNVDRRVLESVDLADLADLRPQSLK